MRAGPVRTHVLVLIFCGFSVGAPFARKPNPVVASGQPRAVLCRSAVRPFGGPAGLVLIAPAFLATHYSPAASLREDNEIIVRHGEFTEAKKHADRPGEIGYRYVPATNAYPDRGSIATPLITSSQGQIASSIPYIT